MTIRGDNVETFAWDGLALIERSGTKYINEPHAGGGNPILAIGESSEDVIFNDILGTSLGVVKESGYSAIDKTSFGADSTDKSSFFTPAGLPLATISVVSGAVAGVSALISWLTDREDDYTLKYIDYIVKDKRLTGKTLFINEYHSLKHPTVEELE